MCGIAGLLRAGRADARVVQRMADALRHRGPDDEGYVAVRAGGEHVAFAGLETAPGCLPADAPTLAGDAVPEAGDLVLGARRLAILDLSPTGHQPMGGPDGTWIVHNGEIYNYRELRNELAAHGHVFRGASDTEVALAAYREWGAACFERFNGMWATAFWDEARSTLVLSRDRFGVKPLYFSALEDGVVFASEIKALLVAGVPARANEGPLRAFLAGGRIDVSGAETCFDGVEQVEPGTYVEWPLAGRPRATRFYSVDARRGAAPAAEAGLLEVLDDAVRLRLRSDVPVGCCLSGGLDSSSLVALAQAHVARDGGRLPTFTYSAAGHARDETRYAAAVAEATGAEASFTDASGAIPDELIATIRDNDEPIGSGSIVAQRRVMALASEHGAKVLLGGQGGDEVFGGYSYYRAARLADLAVSFRLRGWQRELRSAVGNDSLTAAWLTRATLGEARRRRPGHGRLVARQLEDVRLHLPALLHYEDRNSMAFSIETRLPFLDYRVFELGIGLPASAKIDGGWTKVALRRALAGRLPDEVVWRRDKVQFETPQALWLRGPLRELTGDLVLTPAFAARPVSDAAAARELFGRIDTLDAAGARTLWRLLTLEVWYRTYLDSPVRAATEPLARVP